MIELVCYTEGDEGFAARLTARGADMPTILFRQGWRIFFFANEGHEPIHVHCKKGRANGKFWIHPDESDIEQVVLRISFFPTLRLRPERKCSTFSE